MKKLPFIILSAIIGLTMFVTACGDDDNTTDYSAWILANQQWYDSLETAKVGGVNFYTPVVPAWYKNSGVLIHYYNNRALTAGNLRPLITSTVKVKYKGELYNGAPFDSSYTETDSCRVFTIGSGLINGWQVALTDMHVGDSADIIIPYYQAYGVNGSGSIPPYSNLKFSIKLVDITAYEIRP